MAVSAFLSQASVSCKNTRASTCYYFALFRIFFPYGNEWINIIKWNKDIFTKIMNK